MSAAIYYIPEAYSIEGPKLMGRNAAGESFLRGYLKYSKPSEHLWVYVEQDDHAKNFEVLAKKFGREESIRSISKYSLHNAASAPVIFHPGPGIGEPAFHRRLYGDASWSLCGITHTTSSARAMDSIAALLTAPVQPWDAIICPSEAVKKNAENILQAQVQYLKHRLGISRLVQPLFPVIPLGIHTEDFMFSDDQRISSRMELGISEEDLVVLYMGRLSFHAKAHPLAMYQALENTHRDTKKNIVLIECGWHANDYIKDAFTEAAAIACPSVRCLHLDGRIARNRLIAWSGADIFCSLSDNIQETFGIVPIEAMASGLPVVVSDWDGYRDSVRHGVDGFRIPTLHPGPGLKEDLSIRHAIGVDSYDKYCGYSSSFISIDIMALTSAFIELAQSEGLRRKMGEAGQQRAVGVYDWKAIIPQYEELWERQNDIRESFSGRNSSKDLGSDNKSYVVDETRVWPARLDPSVSFSHYATSILDENTLLFFNGGNLQDCMLKLESFNALKMVNFAEHLLPNQNEAELIIKRGIASGSSAVTVSHLVSDFPDERKAFAIRFTAWLAKLGFFRTA